MSIKITYYIFSFFLAAMFKHTPWGMGLANVMLDAELVFGFLPSSYFDPMSLFYGLTANAMYSLIVVFRRVSLLEEGVHNVKPFNKYTWFLVITRPFGAALMSFLFTPVIRILASPMSMDIRGMLSGEGSSILIGLLVGLLFEYLIKKAFFDRVFDKVTKPFINEN